MNLRFKPDPCKPRRKINLLLAWPLMVAAIAFFAGLIMYIISPDSPGNSFGSWRGFVIVMLLSGAIWGTVSVGTVAIFRGFSSRQNFKRFIFHCACFVPLIALLYAEEDWKGKHDWKKFKQQWEAKGENFDRDSFIPKPVPDDENFAMSPIWIAEIKWKDQTESGRAEAWYGNKIYSEEVSNFFRLVPISESALAETNPPRMDTYFPQTPDTMGDWATARMTDLRPWQSFYRKIEQTNTSADITIALRPQTPAQDVLLALSKYDPLIERLRQDSRLPYSRFPIEYNREDPDIILLPHLDAIKEYAKVLELRTIAELQNSQTNKALADVNLMLRLADAIRTEPFLYSHSIRIIVFEIALQPIYEGLADHEWSDSQLAELDSKLANFNFLAEFRLSLRAEMIVDQDGFIEFLHRHPGHIFDAGPLRSGDDDSMSTPTLMARAMGNLIPAGWYYQNKLNVDRVVEEFYLPVIDTNREILSPTSIGDAETVVEAETEIAHVGPYNVFERSVSGSLGEALWVAYGQNAANLARVAIALERYRLAHGEYPDSLTPLEPLITRLPHDVINGQPLHYRRTADGQFLLYSVGWNEKDDGGKVVLFTPDSTGSPPHVRLRDGDWVWRYPESSGTGPLMGAQKARQISTPNASLR